MNFTDHESFEESIREIRNQFPIFPGIASTRTSSIRLFDPRDPNDIPYNLFGPLLTAPVIHYLVIVNSYTGNLGTLQSFVSDITQHSYVELPDGTYPGNGVFGGTSFLNIAPGSYNNTSIDSIVKSAAESGTLPTAPFPYPSHYTLVTPSSLNITIPSGSSFLSSCSGFCGYHDTFFNSVTSRPASFTIAMDVGSGCGICPIGGITNEQTTQIIIAHEWNEAVSDPYLTGWIRSDGQENGDLCNRIPVRWGPAFQWYVQPMWINGIGCITPPYVSTPVPFVGILAPSSGSPGDSIVIYGSNFTGTSQVTFGGVPASSFFVGTDSWISVRVPFVPGGGVVEVRATTPGGTSPIVHPVQFSQERADTRFTVSVPPPPTVTGVSPTSGPTTGGTACNVFGTGFTGATAAFFGGTPGTGLSVFSDTQLFITSPARASGAVDVQVIANNQASVPNAPSDLFTYIGLITRGVSANTTFLPTTQDTRIRIVPRLSPNTTPTVQNLVRTVELFTRPTQAASTTNTIGAGITHTNRAGTTQSVALNTVIRNRNVPRRQTSTLIITTQLIRSQIKSAAAASSAIVITFIEAGKQRKLLSVVISQIQITLGKQLRRTASEQPTVLTAIHKGTQRSLLSTVIVQTALRKFTPPHLLSTITVQTHLNRSLSVKRINSITSSVLTAAHITKGIPRRITAVAITVQSKVRRVIGYSRTVRSFGTVLNRLKFFVFPHIVRYFGPVFGSIRRDSAVSGTIKSELDEEP